MLDAYHLAKGLWQKAASHRQQSYTPINLNVGGRGRTH